jgi:hypothetical protein
MIDSTNITDSELKQTALALANNAENILAAAQEDAGLEKILKFDKGRYLIGEELVPLGSEFLAHCEAWVKQWIKYFDHRVVVQKLYRVDLGERPPEREELDDLDPSRWPPGLDDRPADPWQFYYLLPLE